MKKLAFAGVFVWVTTLMACGGDDDDDVTIVDSGVVDATVEQKCDPVAQEGCEAGEKCAQLTVSAGPPLLVRTDCVPEGDVAIGEACMIGAPGEDTGYDDCVAGAQCVNDLCRPICSSPPDSCGKDLSCSFFVDLFDDIETTDVGVCTEVCDPVLQDCTIEGEGCYLSVFDLEGEATCVGIPEDSVGHVQGDLCNGPDETSCYLNGCEAGYWAVVPTFLVQPDKSPCAAFCQPVDTYIVDPDGDGQGELVEGGNPEGFPLDPDKDPKTPALNCNTAHVDVGEQQCRFFQSIGFSDFDFDHIPAAYGFCADTQAGMASLDLWGKCELDSEERLFKIFDDAEAKTPMSGDDAVQAFCNDDPAGQAGACAVACVSDAKFQEIADAYCKANPGTANCSNAKARARFMELRRQRAERAFRSLMK
jgi:hypothetical protein